MSHVSECPTCGSAVMLTAKMSGPVYTALPGRAPALSYQQRAEKAEAEAERLRFAISSICFLDPNTAQGNMAAAALADQ